MRHNILFLALLSGLLTGCASDPVGPRIPVCNQPFEVTYLKTEIASTFYPSSTWEQAQDALSPGKASSKYGMNYVTQVRLRNPDDARMDVKSSLGQLFFKNEGKPQKTYEATLPEFHIRPRSDTVVQFRFHVDVASLSAEYFKLLSSNENLGTFSRSSYKYGYDSGAVCADSQLTVRTSANADSTIQDYVTVPEAADATWNGTVAAADAGTSAASWTISNWDTIKTTLWIIAEILSALLKAA
jgi:hypothetical protein